MKRWLAGVCLLAVAVAGCGRYVERERATGHRGAARLNPFLAAESFLAELGHPVASGRSWPSPGHGDAMLVMPAGMLAAEGLVREAQSWVRQGGHLVCLFAHAGADSNDWRMDHGEAEKPPEVLLAWLKEAGVRVRTEAGVSASLGRRVVTAGGEVFEISRPGPGAFLLGGARGDAVKARSVASLPCGKGRLTLVGDARVFRNRFIGEAENASLLAHLADLSRGGLIRFVRGSGVSFWSMLWRNGWPGIIGVLAWVVVWLWRSLARFGPTEEEVAPDGRRDQVRHLEATGGFLWRLDRGHGLLGPLRGEVVERLQRRRAAAGKSGDDIFALAAAISGLPRDRVWQALVAPPTADQALFTCITTDLQQLLNTL